MGRFTHVNQRRKGLLFPLLKGLQLGALIALALVVLVPLLWLVSTSLKGPEENIFSSPPVLLPAWLWEWQWPIKHWSVWDWPELQWPIKDFSHLLVLQWPIKHWSFLQWPVEPKLDAYINLFQKNPLTSYLLNSTIVSALAVLANLLFCSLAAYPLARMRFAGRGLVLGLVVATILIPFQVVMIPLYLLMVQLGLRNTLMALVIPQAATAFGIYLLRQSFLAVPAELEEAARIDGCNRLGTWWNVMIPAARADLITLAMFVFIGTWSDFLWPLVILDDPSLYTLPLGLQQLASSSFSFDWRIVAAGSVVSILPVLALFILLQRFILPSATGDAVKG
ncbi:MAG: carbohydrate ABC transporter permease [Prochlorococcus sp.]|jgi:putative chitobiose transport system permease protein|nr:carbohydrate ABC transporter permease [Prochlorococcaceae cyanobacterium ETNP18_MAG_14]MDP6309655.1 carbohydrate ABC transporter permease [Prochlorococcaceae cyanobacterium ETNP14_MAG_4]HJM80649.1 carbohydrate ABC transporter permease [Prochlorococcaceae cyanobacterium Fu_MAG_72]|tara:strand:- start:1335 stop:2342 length:1008 start_codon:yes stop_codon:yes gene_type:complete